MLGPGDVFAGYTVSRSLGPGRLGECYLARHPILPRQAVLEILSAGAAADPTLRQQFTEEVAAAETTPRSGEVAEVDSGEFEGRLWIAREYVEGVDAAWVDGSTADNVTPSRRLRPRRRTALMIAGAVTAVGVAVTAVVVGANADRHPTAEKPRLDGSYRAVYDDTKQTLNGAPRPLPPSSKPEVGITAFRSTCTPSGCVATGTKLDTNNPNTELNRWHTRRHPQRPSVATVWRFSDGQWRLSPPYRFRTDEQRCLSADGQVVPGSDVAVTIKSLESQEDGTLRGVETTTILTNECGAEGQVFQVPYIATRVGDVPAGVTVSDPATVPAPSASNAPLSSPGDPALQGTYRLELTTANQPGSGDPDEEPVETATTEVHAWAIHSECSATRCVATAATVAGDNNDEPTGGASVLRFVNGRWQSSPTLLAPQPCGTGIGEDSETSSFSLEPQPDGSLRGTATKTVLTDECGEQGRVSTMSIVATRVGDVPLSVVLADPTLFP